MLLTRYTDQIFWGGVEDLTSDTAERLMEKLASQQSDYAAVLSRYQHDQSYENSDELRKISDRRWAIPREIERRYWEGYQAIQVERYQTDRKNKTEEAREHARSLVPEVDLSSFGGGWVFVLEFTTIIFIVFSVLSLGVLGVLNSEQIGTILAAIAGYVLGKSTTYRGPGGQEIVRGAEQPTAVLDALNK